MGKKTGTETVEAALHNGSTIPVTVQGDRPGLLLPVSLAHPAPQTLSPGNIAKDLLALADAAGVDRFAYYGYSWLALCGLQLALRTDRLRALAMGGFPPLEGPYRSMLAVTRAAHAMSVEKAGEPAGPVPEPEPPEWEELPEIRMVRSERARL